MYFMDIDGASLLIMNQDSRYFSPLGVTHFSISTFHTHKQNISNFPKFPVFHFHLNKLWINTSLLQRVSWKRFTSILTSLYTTIHFRNVGQECIENDKYQNTI